MSMDDGAESEAETTINRLENEGIITFIESDRLRLTNGFQSRLEREKAKISMLNEDEIIEELGGAVGDVDQANRLLNASKYNDDILAEYLTISKFDGLTPIDHLRTLTILNSLRGQPPRSDGVPEAFIPVDGDRLPFLLQLCEGTIVYIWMEDCDPCDILKNDFNHIFGERPDDLGLFAVYGPEAKEILTEEYQVNFAPVTLYFRQGKIDVRLKGAPTPRATEREIENLRELLE